MLDITARWLIVLKFILPRSCARVGCIRSRMLLKWNGYSFSVFLKTLDRAARRSPHRTRQPHAKYLLFFFHISLCFFVILSPLYWVLPSLILFTFLLASSRGTLLFFATKKSISPFVNSVLFIAPLFLPLRAVRNTLILPWHLWPQTNPPANQHVVVLSTVCVEMVKQAHHFCTGFPPRRASNDEWVQGYIRYAFGANTSPSL